LNNLKTAKPLKAKKNKRKPANPALARSGVNIPQNANPIQIRKAQSRCLGNAKNNTFFHLTTTA